jgi:hypothetical protein
MPMKYVNGRKIAKMAMKYTIIFHCNAFQNSLKFGFFVLKYNIWQPAGKAEEGKEM